MGGRREGRGWEKRQEKERRKKRDKERGKKRWAGKRVSGQGSRRKRRKGADIRVVDAVMVRGATFPLRHDLREHGFTWDKDERVWWRRAEGFSDDSAAWLRSFSGVEVERGSMVVRVAGTPGRRAEKQDRGVCESCGTPLGKLGGYGGTGLCGPCCTGESATVNELGETW